ncbi:MAG: lytic transglycosylase F, partial [bacterium]|nr:lytic transglycosylase F [bacterium]
NIHAGAKYLQFIRNRYFSNPEIDAAAKMDFTWAAYNAGPARIARLRKIAAERGFDPNRWFFNVERIAAEQIGRETVDYVANINKYFIAYRLQWNGNLQRQLTIAEIKSENSK